MKFPSEWSDWEMHPLVRFTYLDPDKYAGKYVRGVILDADNCDDEITQAIGSN